MVGVWVFRKSCRGLGRACLSFFWSSANVPENRRGGVGVSVTSYIVSIVNGNRIYAEIKNSGIVHPVPI